MMVSLKEQILFILCVSSTKTQTEQTIRENSYSFAAYSQLPNASRQQLCTSCIPRGVP